MLRGCLHRCFVWTMVVCAMLQADRVQCALHGNLVVHVVWLATSRDARIRRPRKSN